MIMAHTKTTMAVGRKGWPSHGRPRMDRRATRLEPAEECEQFALIVAGHFARTRPALGRQQLSPAICAWPCYNHSDTDNGAAGRLYMARRGCGLVVLSAGLALALGGCGGPDAPTTRPAAEGAADANRARPSGRAPDERTTKPAVPEPPQPVDDPRIAFRIGRLKSTDWRERWQALSELRQMGADAAPAVPWIAMAL